MRKNHFQPYFKSSSFSVLLNYRIPGQFPLVRYGNIIAILL